jgi:phage terminase Nu1 subunit (DNA packaging protein)
MSNVHGMTTPDLIPTAEVAAIYGCDVRTVHRLVERGRLAPAIKAPGKRGALMFRRADVLTLAAEVAQGRRSA